MMYNNRRNVRILRKNKKNLQASFSIITSCYKCYLPPFMVGICGIKDVGHNFTELTRGINADLSLKHAVREKL